ncbi:MAG: PBP1A family penicillin-binding protein [Patescibacteria group bacterium]|nr:PBP1A family penicillin-binding protein [Patescibacteria group bacterium]
MAKRVYRRKTYKRRKRKKKKDLPLILKILPLFLLLFLVGGISLFLYYVKDFPRPEMFAERQLAQSTKIYDRKGEVLLYEIYGEEKRTWVTLESIPEYLKQAVIAAEDANFYSHFGIDLVGILRAILVDLKIGRPVYGGSTIPQQLIRSTFLSPEKTAERKIREIVLSLELDRRYSKDDILEWYLNQVPFGQNAYGVESASQTYFKKSISEISLSEAATLASLIKAPYRLSPYGENRDDLLNRKDYILNRMRQERFLSKEDGENAKKEEIEFIETLVNIKAPYFTLWIKQQLEEKYGQDLLRVRGLKVYTSLDWEIQEIAEEAAKKGIERNKAFKAHNVGLVAIDPKSGEILAMTVGTGDYYAPSYPEGCASGVDCLFDPKFNVVVGTKNNPGRQPGSAFKPFVYVTAFKKGYDGNTTTTDEETNFGIWGEEEYIPQNYDEIFRGEVTLRQALAQSLNVPSVKVILDLAGLEDSIKTAEDLGITTLKPSYGPSIVLGGWEVKLLEITSAYSAFANDGLKVPPVSILRIEDSRGNILEENKKTPRRVLDSEPVRLINDILSDNVARAPMFGTSSPLYFRNYQVAAKTGTTQDYRDAWTIGYSPSIVTGVWVGNNNNESMDKQPGVMLSSPIWRSFMEKALLKFPRENFPKPKIEPVLVESGENPI